ncbi:MAG: uroporphyrinogen-III synthase [Pseudomonadota bacterium]
MPNRNSLSGIGVLVTRPAHQADPLCDRITEAGGQPVRFPLLKILDNSNSPPVRQQLQRLADYQIAIFVSPNAVQFGLAAIARLGGLPEGLKLAAVGRGTARRLQKQLGRAPDLVPEEQFTSEGLLALPGLHGVAGKRILILRGNGGRELLAKTLRERGAEVDYAEVYRRETPEADAADPGWLDKTDIITLTSSEALENLVSLAEPEQCARLLGKPLVVVSERTETLARELGFHSSVLVAYQASDEAILETIIAWTGNSSKTER